MSETNDKPDLFDPLGVMKGIRDAGVDNWAKVMRELVESDAFSGAQAEMLNAWLATSSPFRKLLEDTISKTMHTLHLATSEDYERLSERLTSIEMRLDDMDAKFDACLASRSENQ